MHKNKWKSTRKENVRRRRRLWGRRIKTETKRSLR